MFHPSHTNAPRIERSAELSITRIAAPAPCPSNVLRARTRDDLPFVLRSGPGDPALTEWSYAALEPVGLARDIAHASASLTGWVDTRAPDLPPFQGGAVGYIGYDCGWEFQARPRTARADPLGLEPARFSLYDAVYARNERTREGFIVAQPTLAAERRADRLRLAVASSPHRTTSEGRASTTPVPVVARATHLDRIRRAKARIADGEIYQVNLTYPIEARFRGMPEAVFSRLLDAPPPFSAFLDLGGERAIVSASPECFLTFDAWTRALHTFPIKGTCRRAKNADDDSRLRDRLARDPKERAEHLMIVDLERNDLGKIAEIGSVAVEGLAYLESFPGIHHMTSSIRGTALTAVPLDAIVRAMFPGGSITGAPKLRAMEIIDELENEARGVYTGIVAWISPSGSMSSSIAIRTATFADDVVRIGVGGGIVADSVPEREWEETEVKAQALLRALVG